MVFAALAVEEVDSPRHWQCVQQILEDNLKRIIAGETEALLEHVHEVKRVLGPAHGARLTNILDAQAAHLIALEERSESTKVESFLAAANRYFLAGEELLWQIGLSCLEHARQAASTPDELGRVTSEKMRLLVGMGRASGKAEYVAAAINAGQSVTLTEPFQTMVSAFASFGEGMIEPDPKRRTGHLRRAHEMAQRLPELAVLESELGALLGQISPPEPDTAPAKQIVGEQVMLASRTGSWAVAVEQLRGKVLGSDNDSDDQPRVVEAAYLALAYQELLEREPHRAEEALSSSRLGNLDAWLRTKWAVVDRVAGRCRWQFAFCR